MLDDMLKRALLALSLLVAACSPPPAAPEPGPPAPVVDYVTRQEILTPLPLRVRLPSRYGAERVLVFFHTWGSRDWNMIELARAGQTWRGEVSCREVSTVTGDTRYFFLALDPDGEIVAGSGTPEWPHIATIVGALPDGPQSLEGQAPPMRCHDPADCPPDFPGCPMYAVRRPACRTDVDCAEGNPCAWDGYCGSPNMTVPAGPTDEDDEERLAAAVRAATKKYKKVASNRR
jgi:hypothetical protein